MAHPAVISIEDKFGLVCSVISGEMSVAEAARPPGEPVGAAPRISNIGKSG
jgi:hypothetical protein